VLRTTLIYGLLETMRKNANAGCFDLKIFETGRVFWHGKRATFRRKKNRIGGLLTGSRYDNRWHYKDIPADFYDIKGCVGLLSEISPMKFREGCRNPSFIQAGPAA